MTRDQILAGLYVGARLYVAKNPPAIAGDPTRYVGPIIIHGTVVMFHRRQFRFVREPDSPRVSTRPAGRKFATIEEAVDWVRPGDDAVFIA